MTDDRASLLADLAVKVADMRMHQRNFFAAAYNTAARAEALAASRRCEREVDELLLRIIGARPGQQPRLLP